MVRIGMAHYQSTFPEYPYHCSFYDRKEPDLSLPLSQRVMEDVLVYQSCCDIQEVSKAANPVLIATFSVFLPFDVEDDIPIRRGMKFVSNVNGMSISGMVTNGVLSQLGGIVAYVKDYTADE